MSLQTGYKLLRADGTSLSNTYGRHTYPLDGSWTVVPGRGAFVGLSVPGLLRGGFGPLLAQVEYDNADYRYDDADVIEVCRVRVVRTTTIDAWTLIQIACRVLRGEVSNDPRGAAVLLAVEAAERCERERTVTAVEVAQRVRHSLRPRPAYLELPHAAWAAFLVVEAAAALLTATAPWAAAHAEGKAAAAAACAAKAAGPTAQQQVLAYFINDAWPLKERT